MGYDPKKIHFDSLHRILVHTGKSESQECRIAQRACDSRIVRKEGVACTTFALSQSDGAGVKLRPIYSTPTLVYRARTRAEWRDGWKVSRDRVNGCQTTAESNESIDSRRIPSRNSPGTSNLAWDESEVFGCFLACLCLLFVSISTMAKMRPPAPEL
jgi:hypothetical protein